MIRIIGERGSGKTTKLLELAEEKDYILVEPTIASVDYVRNMAREKGHHNVNIISAHNLLSYRHRAPKDKYLIDELEDFLSVIGVEGYSNSPTEELS